MKIRVGAVSYLNTRPLVFGFDQGVAALRSMQRDAAGIGRPHRAGIRMRLWWQYVHEGLAGETLLE